MSKRSPSVFGNDSDLENLRFWVDPVLASYQQSECPVQTGASSGNRLGRGNVRIQDRKDMKIKRAPMGPF